MANLVVEAVRQDQTGVATGINTIMRSIGGSVGAQVAAAMLAGHVILGGRFPAESGFTEAFAMSAVAAVVALVATSMIPRPRRVPMPAAGAERAPRRVARSPRRRGLMAGGLPRDVRRIAVVVIVGAVMSILDTTIVNVALETLRIELDAPLSTIQWVSTGYLLALATAIPLTGWAAERFGPRRVWMSAVARLRRDQRPVRPGVERRVADRLPRAAGLRRRDDHADRDDHPRAGRGARAAWAA